MAQLAVHWYIGILIRKTVISLNSSLKYHSENFLIIYSYMSIENCQTQLKLKCIRMAQTYQTLLLKQLQVD